MEPADSQAVEVIHRFEDGGILGKLEQEVIRRIRLGALLIAVHRQLAKSQDLAESFLTCPIPGPERDQVRWSGRFVHPGVRFPGCVQVSVTLAHGLELLVTVTASISLRVEPDPAVKEVITIAHEAARTRTRRLVLLTGVGGAGNTLVGLRVVHAHTLDDLAVERDGAKPTSPAVFLSGNGPLVEVLKYELRSAGGGGSTFVRGVMEYLRRYVPRPALVPPEHVTVFDEDQRAFDPEMIAKKHSAPDLIIEIADWVPEWCVVIGLIGSGQEIHIGEEAGIG